MPSLKSTTPQTGTFGVIYSIHNLCELLNLCATQFSPIAPLFVFCSVVLFFQIIGLLLVIRSNAFNKWETIL